MLKLALLFFIIGVIFAVLGFGAVGGAFIGIAKIIFFIALALFIIFLILGLLAGRAVGNAID